MFAKHRLRQERMRRGLQIAVVLGGLVPVMAGFAGIMLGPGLVDPTADSTVSLDSHFRYLSGLLLGIGICFWAIVPRIEKNAEIFQVLTAIVFVGGLSRLYALSNAGIPDNGMLFGLAMELVVTPLLALWQSRVARHA